MPRRAPDGLLILLVAVFPGGCSAFKIPPLIDASGRAVMIVPLATDTSRRDRIEPFDEGNRTGLQIASLASERVAALARHVRLLPAAVLAREAGDSTVDRWLQGRPAAEVREKLGGADLLCLGTIVHAQLKDPGAVFLLQGRMKIQVVIHDLAAATVRPVELDVSFPVAMTEHRAADPFASVHDYTEEDIYNGLVQAAAKALAELFYAHARDPAHNH